ncbi:hypothetical protein [Enterococcus pallens]|uniref:Lipoprotein n=1 Tax=Enterococcus pallens ATCC BAA-351 TaxID=1158607 RepID=R2QM93_9ENTE|nr:hypothetical protein [Enterococcus pallens]EOH96308.1 hypothetical protein UAU_00958 [Enterococcus pallens ATCC BAA-351]EOU14479.1 hypothetical protein I588_04836 [Enterococcus pallens ATCC BAA-351]OJG81031.1 hypothetical protein RV10_GL004030 [Enterococcus pallens]
MKKYLVLVSTLLLLAACGGSPAVDDSSSSQESSTSVSSSSSQTKESSKQSETTKQSTSSSTTTASQEPAGDNELQQAYPNEQMPSASVVGNAQTISMAASEANNTLTVSYYNTESKLPLNDPQLQNQTPIAQFQRTTYASSAEARNAVAPTFDEGGQAVDLGYNITGYQQSGAGSSYLSWQEGNWNLTVQAININGEDPLPLAQKVVEYLETAFLPVPKDAGQITLSVTGGGYESNVVAWQVDTTVYKTMHTDALSSLQMAVSMKD